MKRRKQEIKLGMAKMEASRGPKHKGLTLSLHGLEDEPLDQLAIEILREHPQLIPDMKKTLRLVRENADRLGISPGYEVQGTIDPEIADMKKIRVVIHVGKRRSAKHSFAIWKELNELKLANTHDGLSLGMIFLMPRD